MAIPSWPAGVPYETTATGYALPQLAGAPLMTEMNAGTVRQRRKYTLPVAEMKLSIRMTAAEFQLFRAFHASIGNGAARFTMPVWNGSAYVTRTAQIKDQPDMSTFAFRTREVAMSLRVENL